MVFVNVSTAPALALTFALAVVGCGGERRPPPTTPDVEGTPAAPPPNDAPEPVVARYFEHLDREVEDARTKLEIARTGEDRGDVILSQAHYAERLAYRREELERLAGRSDGMIAGGILAIVLGGAGLVVGGLYTLVSEIQPGEPSTSARAAAIGITASGAVVLGSGVTLLVFGRGTPPTVGDEAGSREAASAPTPPQPGATLRWTY
jgi:hypothetical protein